MNLHAIIDLGCFTALDIVISLMMIQLKSKHVGECMT
jgi:hypothetical protein